jgi:ABC-type lipoprotein release transport system permease subunit
MKEYLTLFSLIGLTLGVTVFTVIFLRDVGMSYDFYKAWLSILLSFISLISNAAMSYYFVKKTRKSSKSVPRAADVQSR